MSWTPSIGRIRFTMTGAACSQGNGISTIRSWSPAIIATAETSSTSAIVSASRAAEPGEAFTCTKHAGPGSCIGIGVLVPSPGGAYTSPGTTGAVIVRSTPSIRWIPRTTSSEMPSRSGPWTAASTSHAPTTGTAARTPPTFSSWTTTRSTSPGRTRR